MLGAAAGRENVGRLLPVDDISCQNMPRDEINRYIVGRLDTKVEVVFASRRDNKGITVQLQRFKAPLQCCRAQQAI